MRLLFSTILLLCSLTACTQQISQRDGQYELAWQEDFSGKSIDAASWTKIARVPYPWGRHMSSHSSLYRVRGGYLRLYARRNNRLEPADTAKYITGGISSQGKRHITYGKVEVRARIKGAQGTWPAIWLLVNRPCGTEDERYSEIDILEYINRDKFVYQTVHSSYTIHRNKNDKHSVTAQINFEKWNTYAAEILPDKVILSVNGIETFRYPRREGEKGQFPYGIESYLMLDMQVGGGWVKTVDPKTFPAYMDIDWVKMYTLKR